MGNSCSVKTSLGRGAARNTLRRNKAKIKPRLGATNKPRQRYWGLHFRLDRRLRNSCLADVADLTMLLVYRIAVPVSDRLRCKNAD